MTRRALRLMLYDDTCRGPWYGPGLTHSWIAGGALYGALGRLDVWVPVRSVEQAMRAVVEAKPALPIAEIQYWGHGKWGEFRVADDRFDRGTLDEGHPLAPLMDEVAARLTGPDALFWLRTCESFGGTAGHEFAEMLSARLCSRVAGHTFIIGPWQSGLHSLDVGQSPTWSPTEGIRAGTPEQPRRAFWSGPRQPHTIHCLQGAIPNAW